MSVLVPSLINSHHSHTAYFPSNNNIRHNGTMFPSKQNCSSGNKLNENDQDSDHVPFGVVNSMKQRFLNKVNETFLFNPNSTTTRQSLSKSSTRILSNENLLQSKPSLSPLKRTTRLSRSQDNLTNSNNNNNHAINYHPIPIITAEQFTSYIQPKQEVIIVDTTTATSSMKETSTHHEENEKDLPDDKLHSGQIQRQSYTELHVDEAPKPGTVTTVKNMFERQIRLSRYDADKIFNTVPSGGSRVSSLHRDIASPTRSRSISPNDMALRQRRTINSSSTLPSTTLSLPTQTSYPDLVISHTPPAETNKTSVESTFTENLLVNKEKKTSLSNRNSMAHEQIPLSVVVDDISSTAANHPRPNLLLPSTVTIITPGMVVDNQTLDFKSRLALFNRTNIPQSNEIPVNIKKPPNQPNLLTKPVVHQPVRIINDEKKDVQPASIPNPLSIPISRSVVNTAKAVTFFGGNKLNGNTTSSLPISIPPPPVPSIQINNTNDQSSVDPLRAPVVVGGNIKLNKSSISSGAKKNVRVQFVDNVDTYEYPSYEITMAELGNANSDDDDDDDDQSNGSSNGDSHHHMLMCKPIDDRLNEKQQLLIEKTDLIDDVDDEELEHLARINAKFNTNNLAEKSLKPKGTLHTFRPTHLDQYELGTQHGSFTACRPSDMSSSTNAYTILARQKLLSSSDTSTKSFSNHSIIKPAKSNFDMVNNIQWSSMSTTTDLLF